MNIRKIHIIHIIEILAISLYLFLISFQWFAEDSDFAVAIQKTRIIQLAIGYIIVFTEIYLSKYIHKLKIKRTYNFAATLFTIIVFSIVWNYSSTQIAYILNLSEPFSFKTLIEKEVFKFTVFYLIPNSLFYCIYLLINLWYDLTIQKQKVLEAQSIANAAQLKMLNYQISPHFLFNTLNTVRYMIEEDKEQARNMITYLSDFFRYTLSKKNELTDKFGNELTAVKNFLQVQKIRFDDKLEYTVNCKKEIEELITPFFVLYPLVENALKYGIKTSGFPLKLEINITLDAFLKIEVKNTGNLSKSSYNSDSFDGTGTGIDNLKKRLYLTYESEYSFSLYEKEGWVYAIVTVPNMKQL